MIVNSHEPYDYQTLSKDIRKLKLKYPWLSYESIGQSVEGRELYAIKLGNGKNKVLYNGAHHALEWITSLLLMRFVECYLAAQNSCGRVFGFDVSKLFNYATIYVVPMVNPDGVNLVINGITPNNIRYRELVAWNHGSDDFSTVWQSNIHGVDLNHNYDAGFYEQRVLEEEMGITGPGPTRYSGPRPFSEPETRCIAQLTSQVNPKLVIAYHSQPEVIYYQYLHKTPPNAKLYGELFEGLSGYMLDETEGIASYGGYKDWFIELYNKPGYTVEVGLGKNPLPITQIDEIVSKNFGILFTAPLL